MNSRNMSGGSLRDDRQLGEKRQINLDRSGNGEESSDSSTSMNEKDRGRKKQKTNGENRKEQIQGNIPFIHIIYLIIRFLQI